MTTYKIERQDGLGKPSADYAEPPMTKREEYAKAAMQAILTGKANACIVPSALQLARDAFMFAEAMIEVGEKP